MRRLFSALLLLPILPLSPALRAQERKLDTASPTDYQLEMEAKITLRDGADGRVAHIRLLQEPGHPSTLTIPLGDPAAPCKASATW
jgi:hypothetical protein